MREIGPATEQDMVDAFVQAEIDSPRFKDAFRASAKARGGDIESIWDSRYAQVRVEMLGDVRGYGRNQALFRDFPTDSIWRFAELDSAADWARVLYANYWTWAKLSGGTGLVRDGAANLHKIPVEENGHSLNAGALALIEALKSGTTFPPILAVASAEAPERLVLIEGHTRATAYAAAGTLPVPLIIGTSPAMKSWAYY